jgi:hypothetical protein
MASPCSPPARDNNTVSAINIGMKKSLTLGGLKNEIRELRLCAFARDFLRNTLLHYLGVQNQYNQNQNQP